MTKKKKLQDLINQDLQDAYNSKNVKSNDDLSTKSAKNQQKNQTATVTKQDIQSLANQLNQTLKNQQATMKSSFDATVQSALAEAIEQAKDTVDQNMKQQLAGLQSRVDIINVSKTKADQLASADHSKIEQLHQVSNQVIDVVNHNSQTETQLIEQLKQPVEINGHEVIEALEDEANTTMHQLITRQVAQSILDAQTQVRDDRKAVASAKEAVEQAVSNLKADIVSEREYMFLLMSGLIITTIVPNVIMKTVIGAVTIIGGFIYGKIKS